MPPSRRRKDEAPAVAEPATWPSKRPRRGMPQQPLADLAGAPSNAAGSPLEPAARPDRGDGSAVSDAPAAKRPRRVARARMPTAMRYTELAISDRESGPRNADTVEGHYQFTVGDNLTPRFKIMRKFGEGTFGRVVECWDRRRGDYVAVKIIRNVQKYRDAAMVELQVLATLAAHDPGATRPLVRLLEWFDYRGHVCMVFERLGPSLYDCLRRNAYKPFPLPMVRAFLRQLLHSVVYMHELSLIHTDLKPENVLFLDQDLVSVTHPPGSKLARKLPRRAAVRLIDFGSATFDEDYHSTIVCTRHYRAPEIILGLGWSHPCDMWSLGCILVELVTGDALFQTHENLEHLALMEAVVGPMPEQLAQAGAGGSATALFVVAGTACGNVARLNWPLGAESKKSVRAVAKMRPLREHLAANTDGSVAPYLDTITDLVHRMMAWEPAKRCTAQEALQHPFFDEPDPPDL